MSKNIIRPLSELPPDVDRLYYAHDLTNCLYIFWTWQERQLFSNLDVCHEPLTFLYSTNWNKEYHNLINTALKQNNFYSAEETRAGIYKATPDIYGKEANGQLAYEGDKGLNAYFAEYENRF